MATSGRQPPREGAQVNRGGQDVGIVTSGNFSPTLGHGIALGLLAPDVEIGDRVELAVRGRTLDATVVALPFVPRPS
jgi:aminomethyltransferase